MAVVDEQFRVSVPQATVCRVLRRLRLAVKLEAGLQTDTADIESFRCCLDQLNQSCGFRLGSGCEIDGDGVSSIATLFNRLGFSQGCDGSDCDGIVRAPQDEDCSIRSLCMKLRQHLTGFPIRPLDFASQFVVTCGGFELRFQQLEERTDQIEFP